jgi:hypothetical protein
VTSADLIAQARVETSPSTVAPVSRRHSQDAGQHLLRRSGKCFVLVRLIGLPGDGIPDLQPRVGADDDAVTLQGGVVRSPCGIVTRPCLSGTSSEALAKKTRL